MLALSSYEGKSETKRFLDECLTSHINSTHRRYSLNDETDENCFILEISEILVNEYIELHNEFIVQE